MGNNITLRKAKKSDAADLAILDNVASFGLSLWFWQGAVKSGKADDAYEWGRQRMGNGNEVFGYKNAVVAEKNEVIAGVAVGYMVNKNDMSPDKAFDPVIAPVFELFSKCEGDWLLDCLAVYRDMRKQGIGASLMDDCFLRAKNAGAKNVSLVAEDDNFPALSLYKSRGFNVSDKREYVPYKKGVKSKNWLLMSAQL